jgi:TonB family protein
MVWLERRILSVLFILWPFLIRAQSNSCLQKTELLQLQSSELMDVTSIMRSKNWGFDGAKEWPNASGQNSSAINQAVSWKSPLGDERLYYYDNRDRPNFAIALLSESCYNALLSVFNKEQAGVASIQDGALMTAFSVGGVNVEFLEAAKKKQYQVRLYSIEDMELFKGFFDSTVNPDGGTLQGNWFLADRRLVSYPQIQGSAPDEGTVTVDIWVDQSGNVTKAIANAAKSNTSNGTLFKMAEDTARKAKFNISPTDNEQKGTIKITFKLN